jgi:predicted tellurium resistance membrane protein TerC
LAAVKPCTGDLIVSQLLTLENLTALATLASLEIVLGVDNIVFLAILTGKLPPEQQPLARRVGLILAALMRILLLLVIGWVMGLTMPLFSIPQFWTLEPADHLGVSGRDLILLAGGLFLIGKATYEIHDKLEGALHEHVAPVAASFGAVVFQVMLIDVVFSLDSVITAVGMVQVDPDARWIGLTIMIVAVLVAVAVMLAFAGWLSNFVERHPTIKMLALSFLILIGLTLVVEGLHAHVSKGYVYFAMAFSLFVELLNLRLRKVSTPVRLREAYVAKEG